MILFAKLHARLIKVSLAVAATALTLAVLGGAGEWFFRQIRGLNVIHAWLEPVQALVAIGAVFCLPSVWSFRPEAGRGNHLVSAATAFTLLTCLVLAMLLLDFSAASSAYWTRWSLSTPVVALTIAMLLCFLVSALAILHLGSADRQLGEAEGNSAHRRPSIGESSFLENLAWPDKSKLFPLLLMLLSMLMLVAAGPADEAWYSVTTQIIWNLVSGSDLSAAVFVLLLCGFWCALEPGLYQLVCPKPADGALISSRTNALGAWPGVVKLVAALSPFGPPVLLACLVTGVELGRVWAALLLPWAGLILALAILRIGAAPEQRLTQTSMTIPASRLSRAIVPLAFICVLGLVLRGLGRPVELAAVALLITVVCLVILEGPRTTWRLVKSASLSAYPCLGQFVLWVVAAVLFYAACGLTGLQALLAVYVLDLDLSVTTLALMATFFLVVLARWLAPAPLIIIALALLLPVLSFAGFSLPWLALFFPLTVYLGWHLNFCLQSRHWPSCLSVGWLLSMVIALIVWPDTLLRFARLVTFW